MKNLNKPQLNWLWRKSLEHFCSNFSVLLAALNTPEFINKLWKYYMFVDNAPRFRITTLYRNKVLVKNSEQWFLREGTKLSSIDELKEDHIKKFTEWYLWWENQEIIWVNIEGSKFRFTIKTIKEDYDYNKYDAIEYIDIDKSFMDVTDKEIFEYNKKAWENAIKEQEQFNLKNPKKVKYAN